MQIFLQYCYSAILNIELHCSKYCEKIIIFYLSLSPLFCLSSLTLSPLSLISHPCLSSLSLHRRTQQPQPSTISCHPQPRTISRSSLVSVSHPCLFIVEPSTRNPAPYHAIRNSHPQPNTIEHSPRIRDPRPTIHNWSNGRARHGANEVLGFIEAKFWNLGFFVCGFCWLIRFWLIYEVFGVWVDGLLLDYFTISLKMKAPVEVTDRRELKMRERRETGEKI